jgi:hypothetical protein
MPHYQDLLLGVAAAGAIGFLVAFVYFDAHLWTRRERGRSLLDMFHTSRRWFQSDMYTPDGDRYRRKALRAGLISLSFVVLYAVLAWLWLR